MTGLDTEGRPWAAAAIAAAESARDTAWAEADAAREERDEWVRKTGKATERAIHAEADLTEARAALGRVEALIERGVFDVRVWGESGTPFSNGAAQAFRLLRAALGDRKGETT